MVCFRSLQLDKGRSSGIHVALRRDREGWPSGWAIPVKGTESIADIGGANQTRRYRFAQCGRYLGRFGSQYRLRSTPKPGSRFASLPSSNQRRERAAGRAFAPASLHLASIDRLYPPIGSSKRVADEGCASESALPGLPARQRLESCRMSALGHSRRLRLSALCPVYLKQQTFPDPVGTSQLCHKQMCGRYSITSLARPIRCGGRCNRSALAVCRLMYNSSFVTCWTGRSAGLSPLRIRPV